MAFALPKHEPAVFATPTGEERRRITRMRTALVMSSPYYGILAMRLIPKEGAEFKTAATDGKHFFYNPAYIAGMEDSKLKGLIAHQVGHCFLGHIWRRGTRDPRLWNIACDYALDAMLVRAKFDVPNPLVNPAWAGWSAEQIYAVLGEPRQGSGQGNAQPGDGNDGQSPDDAAEEQSEDATQRKQPGQAGNTDGGAKSKQAAIDAMFGEGPTKGEVLDAPAETAIQDQAEWNQAVVAAAQVAKSQGSLPGDLELLIQEIIAPKVDWKSITRRFAQMCASLDYSWRTPSQRYTEVYLPRLRSEHMPPFVIGWDTSGSMMSAKDQATVMAEVSAIIEEVMPEVTHVVFFDARVTGTQEFMPGDPLKYEPRGGGGTRFEPVFEWIEEQGIDPACLMMFTDMYGSFPSEEPSYPVLWASTTKPSELSDRYQAPFGEMVYLDFE